MNSAFRSLTHHIFFSPRPKVVVSQENADGLAPHALHDVPPNSLLGCKLDRPTRATGGRVRANHRYDFHALFVGEKSRRSFARHVVDRALQPSLFISTTNTTNGGFARACSGRYVDRCPALVEELKNPRSLEHTHVDSTA